MNFWISQNWANTRGKTKKQKKNDENSALFFKLILTNIITNIAYYIQYSILQYFLFHLGNSGNVVLRDS